MQLQFSPFILLILSAYLSFGQPANIEDISQQHNFEKGSYFDLNGKRQTGLIKWYYNSHIIHFKSDSTSKSKKLKAWDLSAFKVKSDSFTIFENFKYGHLTLPNEFAYAKVIESGDINLYLHYGIADSCTSYGLLSNLLDLLDVETSNDDCKLVYYKVQNQLLNIKGSNKIILLSSNPSTFKKQLMDIFSEYPVFKASIYQNKYTKDNVQQLIQDFNNLTLNSKVDSFDSLKNIHYDAKIVFSRRKKNESKRPVDISKDGVYITSLPPDSTTEFSISNVFTSELTIDKVKVRNLNLIPGVTNYVEVSKKNESSTTQLRLINQQPNKSLLNKKIKYILKKEQYNFEKGTYFDLNETPQTGLIQWYYNSHIIHFKSDSISEIKKIKAWNLSAFKVKSDSFTIFENFTYAKVIESGNINLYLHYGIADSCTSYGLLSNLLDLLDGETSNDDCKVVYYKVQNQLINITGSNKIIVLSDNPSILKKQLMNIFSEHPVFKARIYENRYTKENLRQLIQNFNNLTPNAKTNSFDSLKNIRHEAKIIFLRRKRGESKHSINISKDGKHIIDLPPNSATELNVPNVFTSELTIDEVKVRNLNLIPGITNYIEISKKKKSSSTQLKLVDKHKFVLNKNMPFIRPENP